MGGWGNSHQAVAIGRGPNIGVVNIAVVATFTMGSTCYTR